MLPKSLSLIWRRGACFKGMYTRIQIIALEQRIELLELQMTLLVKNNLLAPKRSRRQKNKKRARTGLLPSDLVSLVDFATQHALSETPRVLMALESTCPGDTRRVGQAKNTKSLSRWPSMQTGGATFYQLYRDACIFVECDERSSFE